jgi:hypothetical protein
MSKYGPQNSWLFCSLNNIPDGVTACADLVLQTTHQSIVIFLFVFVSVASCRSQSIVQQECQCTVSCWSMQFACAWHSTAVRLATTCFFLEILL